MEEGAGQVKQLELGSTEYSSLGEIFNHIPFSLSCFGALFATLLQLSPLRFFFSLFSCVFFFVVVVSFFLLFSDFHLLAGCSAFLC